MAIKNALLGGTDWDTPAARIKPTDLNDTFDAVVTLLNGTIEDFSNQQLEQNINILINSAAASSGLNPYDDMFLDIFTDATGFDDTVDTGNTTAIFNTDHYETFQDLDFFNAAYVNADFSSSTYVLKQTWDPTVNFIEKVTVDMAGGNQENRNCYIKLIFKYADATPDWEQEQFEFSVNRTTHTWTNPNPNTEISTIEVWHKTGGGGGTSGRWGDVEGYTIFQESIVQTASEAITADPIAHQLISHSSVDSSLLSYDVSFDDGTTWITDQPLGTYNQDVHSGSSMKIKLNIPGGSPSTEVDDYAIMLFY